MTPLLPNRPDYQSNREGWRHTIGVPHLRFDAPVRKRERELQLKSHGGVMGAHNGIPSCCAKERPTVGFSAARSGVAEKDGGVRGHGCGVLSVVAWLVVTGWRFMVNGKVEVMDGDMMNADLVRCLCGDDDFGLKKTRKGETLKRAA
ncbi:hypothetical protein M0R45_009118 [Rubus argutus]|uniref:Uncharacterized protein n=1 Tax=Rubus argutus TaxID=59490 RepID=A0AAW1Y6J2_RUBAR